MTSRHAPVRKIGVQEELRTGTVDGVVADVVARTEEAALCFAY